MFGSVTIPVWLMVLILGFAVVTFASHFLFPSVRWFFRKRMERLVARVNARLDRPIEPFRLARRPDMIVRLLYDPRVLQAVADHAAETGVPGSVAFEEARRYAREIVPGFSATVYFGFGARAARWLSRKLYRVRVGGLDAAMSAIDPQATVIFVMNHRSNMDYVLVTWLVSLRSTLSYAVGEWARVWPLSWLVRSMGGYFIRRKSRNPLYRKVLARYVQMITQEGTTQAIFPEGGLSLDGRVGQARMGLLSYIVQDFRPDHRDVVFVPVGLAYDRVLEDRLLTEANAAGERRFRANPLSIMAFAGRTLWRIARKRFPGFGTAAAAFGAPLSLRAWLAAHPHAPVEALGHDLMLGIGRVVPVVPVPLVAAALAQQPQDRPALDRAVARMAGDLQAAGAVLKMPPAGLAAAVDEALAPLVARGIIGPDLRPMPGGADLIAFYAASAQQRLLSDDAATPQT